MPQDAVSRRTDGPTPNGGAYSIGYFFHEGRPVPQRFASRILIIEYDENDNAIHRTLGHTTPQESPPSTD